MNKFDQIVQEKLEQLNEQDVAVPVGAVQQQAQPGVQPNQAQQQPQQQETPEQTLTRVFQTLKFSDPNGAIKTLNTAVKGAGKVPGINEFFSTLAYDPQKGFVIKQQQPGAPAQAPAPQANATTPLK